MLETGSYTGGSPTEPNFDDGWWGYVSKDLRDIFGPTPKAPWSRGYCGDGSKTKCKAGARKEPRGSAQGDAGGAVRRRRRRLRRQPAAVLLRRQPARRKPRGIELGAFPFQNRPTFQQVVTLTQKLPR